MKLTKEGYLPLERQLEASINGWYFGNIIFGGLIGILIVDPATGAMWKISEENINVKLYPDSKEGKVAMATEMYNGESAFNSGDYDQAINETTIAIGYFPEYLDGYCVRSAAYAKKGEFDKAMADANEAIKLNPDYHRGYKERAELYLTKGEFDKSLADLNKALDIKADYADALYLRGKTYVKLNKNIEAKSDFQSACKIGNSAACNQQI